MMFGDGETYSIDIFDNKDAIQPPSLDDCSKGISLEDYNMFDRYLNGKVLTDEEYYIQFEEYINARRNT